MRSKKVVLAVLCLAGLALGISIAESNRVHAAFRAAFVGPTPTSSYTPRFSHADGEQVALVYVGRRSCAWCNRPETKQLVGEAIEVVAHRADSLDLPFVAIGVGLDWEPSVAYEHLREVARFDEVSVGYSWANSQALEYLWGDLGGQPSVPHLIVLRRTLNTGDTASIAPRYAVDQERVLARKVGLFELRQWKRAGYPVYLGSN